MASRSKDLPGGDILDIRERLIDKVRECGFNNLYTFGDPKYGMVFRLSERSPRGATGAPAEGQVADLIPREDLDLTTKAGVLLDWLEELEPLRARLQRRDRLPRGYDALEKAASRDDSRRDAARAKIEKATSLLLEAVDALEQDDEQLLQESGLKDAIPPCRDLIQVASVAVGTIEEVLHSTFPEPRTHAQWSELRRSLILDLARVGFSHSEIAYLVLGEQDERSAASLAQQLRRIRKGQDKS